MDPFVADAWHDFAVATAGAAGALAGLIIVAISVNIKEIISGSALPARAGATIASVVVIVVSASVMLIPDQSGLLLGLQITGFGLGALIFQTIALRQMFASHEGASTADKIGQAVIGIGQLVPVLVGGVMVAAGDAGGLYAVAAGFVAIFIVSVVNAWVLMVEILR